jgi:hypothetical protein
MHSQYIERLAIYTHEIVTADEKTSREMPARRKGFSTLR